MASLDLSHRLSQSSAILHPVLLELFENWYAERGGAIVRTDMKRFPVPLPIYAAANLFGTFDGSTVYLHENEKEVGGAHFTTLDAMHLGMHCVQMSMPDDMAARMGLRFDGAQSRHDIYETEVTPERLPIMVAYEAETHSMILGWVTMNAATLEGPLQKAQLSLSEFRETLRDFYAADLTYVEHVLATNELPLLADFFTRLDQDPKARARFEEIKDMIRPVETQHITGVFLNKLPDGEIIFGVRGPEAPKAKTKPLHPKSTLG